jgi:hypothetical protein
MSGLDWTMALTGGWMLALSARRGWIARLVMIFGAALLIVAASRARGGGASDPSAPAFVLPDEPKAYRRQSRCRPACPP